MNKQEFLDALRRSLSGVPESEIAERIDFYGEILDDKIEEGLTEEQAVEQLGDLDDIVSQILSEIPLTKLARERVKPRRKMRVWEIVLLAMGSPIWLTLLLVAFSVLISLIAVGFSVIVSLWAVFGAFVGGGVGGFLAGIFLLLVDSPASALLLVGAGLALAGLSIFAFFGCKAATYGAVLLTKKTLLAIKRLFVRREEV